jgi:L-ascorbate 6-phosphate lactonase
MMGFTVSMSTDPIKSGDSLVEQITESPASAITLWWLGHCGFAVKFANIVFLIDPCLTEPGGRTRIIAPPFSPERMTAADLILCTHAHPGHMDPATLKPLLMASARAKVVLPKSAAAYAQSAGIPFDRMATTDAGLRVEFFKEGLYGRIYAVPSAHEHLDYTPLGGYPYLGYLIRFGSTTIYHAGDCAPYDDLAQWLRPYNVTIALLPVSRRNFSASQAADLASEIGAKWLVPMHYGTLSDDSSGLNQFVEHMLGHRPEQRFKTFVCGERWVLPGEQV